MMFCCGCRIDGLKLFDTTFSVAAGFYPSQRDLMILFLKNKINGKY